VEPAQWISAKNPVYFAGEILRAHYRWTGPRADSEQLSTFFGGAEATLFGWKQ
jgi:hypothetical protein